MAPRQRRAVDQAPEVSKTTEKFPPNVPSEEPTVPNIVVPPPEPTPAPEPVVAAPTPPAPAPMPALEPTPKPATPSVEACHSILLHHFIVVRRTTHDKAVEWLERMYQIPRDIGSSTFNSLTSRNSFGKETINEVDEFFLKSGPGP